MHRNAVNWVRAAIAGMLVFGALASTSAPAGATTPRWTVLPSPSPAGPPVGELASVSCASATSCFAVGQGAVGASIEAWNGTNWAFISTPSPAGASVVELNGVSCPSSTSCFAVGDSGTETATSLTVRSLVEHWNGTKWAVGTIRTPLGATDVTLSSVSCSSSTSCFAVGNYSTSSFSSDFFTAQMLVEQWNGATWTIVTLPKPRGATDTEITGVSCPTTTSCFAVGDYASFFTAGAFIEKWDGTQWTLSTSPSVFTTSKSGARPQLFSGFSTSSGLTAVSCSSSSSCIAVGDAIDGSLIEQWNGTSWSIVPAPIQHGSDGDELTAVSCVSPTDCTAVGDAFIATADGFDEISAIREHWDGTAWTIVPGPSGTPVGSLSGVSCPTSASCAAVGDAALVEHWDGTSWTVAPFGTLTSQSQLQRVSCASPTNCFAVGNYASSSGSKTLVEHWNGLKWSTMTSPNPSGSLLATLLGVACRGSANCTAVGASENASSIQTLVEHWDGTSWTIVPSPNPSGSFFSELLGVSCPTSTTCNAVGVAEGQSSATTLAEHWDGSSWSITSTATPSGSDFTELNAVSCGGSTSCNAVGSYDVPTPSGDFVTKTLAEHWDGTSWTVVAGPSPSATSGDTLLLNGITCRTTTTCTAVGYVTSDSGAAPDRTLVERWNGTSWTIVPSTNPYGSTGASLNAVACTNSSSCYAVGGSSTATSESNTLVEHFDGTSWSIAASANPNGAGGSVLTGVSCPSYTMCIAVGGYATQAGFFTLTEVGV